MIEIRVPDEQEGTKAVVRAWLKQIGDAVAENDPLVELETDKVTQEVPSPAAGVLTEIVLNTDAEAVPGALLGRISTKDAPSEQATPAKADQPSVRSQAAPPQQPVSEIETRLSPSVRRACLQHGIDPSRVSGTGRNGRITREDVDRLVASATVVSVGERATAQPRNFSAQDIPHDRMRMTIAENMVRAVSESPHVTAVFEADFSAIAAHKTAMAARGTKLSYTAYIVKAAAEAMAVAPAINGRWEKDRIAISPTIDIGVGTALGEKGLVVPVVKDAGSLSLEQVGAKLDDLVSRGRPADVGERLLTDDDTGSEGVHAVVRGGRSVTGRDVEDVDLRPPACGASHSNLSRIVGDLAGGVATTVRVFRAVAGRDANQASRDLGEAVAVLELPHLAGVEDAGVEEQRTVRGSHANLAHVRPFVVRR